jgi:hypothetical protein
MSGEVSMHLKGHPKDVLSGSDQFSPNAKGSLGSGS